MTHLTDMQIRLAKLEGALDAYKLLFTLIMAVLIGGFAFLGVQSIRMDGRIAGLSADVQALPGKINGDLQSLTGTLAETIAAAKQTPPQIILMPAPPSFPTPGTAAPGGPAPHQNPN